MNSLHIIPAGSNDIDSLLVFMECFYAIDNYSFNKEQTRTSLTEFISQPEHGMIWMINVNNITIGYIVLAVVYSFEFGGRNAFIDEFYLEKEYRGKGIGKTVMEYITKEAKHLNIKAIHLEVEQHNEKALNLYRAFQFKDHHRILMTRMINE
jgi:ribosomal protein S18 acetylase RimI-like enzyme